MSTPADVLNALMAQLQASDELDYIEDSQIFLGARESITVFPTICIEREKMDEEEFVYPLARLRMEVVLIICIKTHDKESQLVGSGQDSDGATVRGTLDVENDVKLAIDADRTLGGVAIHTKIMDSVDGIIEMPVRSVNLRLEILFQQTRAVRS